MQLHFKTSHASPEEEVVFTKATSVAERKIRLLKKLLANQDEITQVYVELGKESEAHQKGNVWRTQINLDSGGKRYHADATAENIENSITTSVEQLETELRKAKQKRQSMLRRGGEAVKSLIRGTKLP